MRRGVAALECVSKNELAWLILRVTQKLSPCSKTSLIAYISGDYATSPTSEIIFDALSRLEALALIQIAAEQIAITDKGRRFLNELAVDPLSPRTPFAFLTAPNSPAQHAPHPKRFWHDYVAGNRTLMRRMMSGRPTGIALQLRKRALLISSGATTSIHRLRALVWMAAKARGPTPWAMAAGRSRLVLFGGALLVVATATAGAFALLSIKRVENSRGETVVLNTTEVSGSPTVTEEPKALRPKINRREAVRIAVQEQLVKLTSTSEMPKREQEALIEYYSVPAQPLLWVDENGLTNRATAVMQEIARADDYGLRSTDYQLPEPEGFNIGDGGDVDWLTDAEIKIDFAFLRYARDAGGGRVNPARLTKNLSRAPLADPSEVLNTIALRPDPAAYLRGFQPVHPQFELLRQKLLELRAQASTSQPSVIIPDGPVLKKGVEQDQVALLRKRLDMPSPAVNENLFDDALDEAVRKLQTAHGVTVDGVVGTSTRRILNQEASGGAQLAQQRRILLNMERWRWLPHDLGPFYVNVNVPEFMARVVQEGKVIHATRVVVGTPDKQTPIFSDEMQEIVFGPYWNVPTSIKVEEIRPYLNEETPWFLGGGWNTSVFQRHGLRVRYGGREVDPASLDWDRVDIRNLEIFQPPGPDNVLGKIKFVFPNEHDVYMHDTTQKELFANPIRAESHGCVRVQNPEDLAAVVLGYDQGWDAARVASAIENGYDQHVALQHNIRVHITYFTLWVNDDGSMSSFADIYGHDARMAAALFGDSEGFDYPKSGKKERETPVPRENQAPWDEAASDDIVGSIIRLFGN